MGQVYEFPLVFGVDAVVLPQKPAPCAFPRVCRARSCVERLHNIPGGCGLNYRCQRAANGDGAPWRFPGEGYSGACGTVAVVFPFHGVGYGVDPLFAVAQVGTAIIAVDTALAQEHPPFVAYFHQGGECEPMAVLRRCADRCVGYIILLVARFGAFPSYHRVALRGHEHGCLFRETVARGFAFNHHASAFSLRGDDIAECYVVVGNLPFNFHLSPFGVFECGCQGVGVIIYVALLELVLVETFVDSAALGACQCHVAAEIADIAFES